MFYHSITYFNVISIFSKQWKPSVRPLSMISIRIYPTKGEIGARRAGIEHGSGALAAKAAGGIGENPYPSYPHTCTVSITNPAARIT